MTLTVGIDIGTSSVKAVAVDDDGTIVRRSRVPHAFHVPAPERFEHDATQAWMHGPLRALAELGDVAPRGVSVAAMIPSLTAVGHDGTPCAPGLIYGDERGRPGADASGPAEVGEVARFLRWHVEQHPDAGGYWMAQGVANHALAGRAVISTTLSATAHPLVGAKGWDAGAVTAAGARVEQMGDIAPSGTAAGEVVGLRDCVLEAGTIDAMGEQIVAGADAVGDVLAILGTTLIVWTVVPDPVHPSPFYCVPHTAPGGVWMLGGPSNAGGLFLEWAHRLAGGPAATRAAAASAPPGSVPVWVPYPRGERVPLGDPSRRAELVDLDLTHDAAAVRRAAYEASGFVTRRMIEAAPVPARRIVATGGGTRDAEWVQALADTSGLPVHVSAVPEGGALGAAFLARMAAGEETSMQDAARWRRYDRVVDPRADWSAPCSERYERFRVIAGPRARAG